MPDAAVAAARDEAAARAALTPDLAARLASAELLPPADRRWTDYRVVAVVRAADGRVQIAVQIYAPASFSEQIITLEERAGRWLVANLDPLTAIR